MMSLVAIKAVVFLMILCNAPSGGTCPIDMYVPDTGFVTISATPTRSNLGDSFTASYTLNGKNYSFKMGEPDTMVYEIHANGQKLTPDFAGTLMKLTQKNNLYGPQEIKLDGKTYDFQETRQNYYLVDPNSDFILIMPADDKRPAR